MNGRIASCVLVFVLACGVGAQVPFEEALDPELSGALPEIFAPPSSPLAEMGEEAPRCGGIAAVIPYPYCHSGTGGGLAFCPGNGARGPSLLFLTQTTYEEDFVWLDSLTFEELGRCDPGDNKTIAAAVFDSRLGCGGESLFVANSTVGSGTIRQMQLFPATCPTSCGCCQPGDNGEDAIACRAGALCQPLREFGFEGYVRGHRVEALAVAELRAFARPLLVAGNFTTGEILFVDPSSPSEDAERVERVHHCSIYDAGRIVRPTGLAWPGDESLLVASRDTGLVYRIDPVSCDVISRCRPLGSGGLNGLAYDRAQRKLFVADDEYSVIFRMEPPAAGPDCS